MFTVWRIVYKSFQVIPDKLSLTIMKSIEMQMSRAFINRFVFSVEPYGSTVFANSKRKQRILTLFGVQLFFVIVLRHDVLGGHRIHN